MSAMDVADLRTIDRDVMRAFGAWTKWKSELERDPKGLGDRDPIEPWRHVAGQRTYEALGGLAVSAIDRSAGPRNRPSMPGVSAIAVRLSSAVRVSNGVTIRLRKPSAARGRWPCSSTA